MKSKPIYNVVEGMKSLSTCNTFIQPFRVMANFRM